MSATGLADGLALHAPPLALPRIDVSMLWHRRQEHDAGARWLRVTVGEVIRGLGVGRPAEPPAAALRREAIP